MVKISKYELEREANIARNKAFLEQLQLKQAVDELTEGLPSTSKKQEEPKSREPRKKRQSIQPDGPRRKSGRLLDATASPETKRKRQAELQELDAAEQAVLVAQENEERERKRARHDDIDLKTEEALPHFDNNSQESTEPINVAERLQVDDLRNKLQNMRIVAQHRVGASKNSRIYSSTFHRDVSKDLIFFGDKSSGKLNIWDVRAPTDIDEDADVSTGQTGKMYGLKIHAEDGSISSIKVDPLDANMIYTTSYDSTIRRTSLVSQSSNEVYAIEDTLISHMDISSTGELWISDNEGGVTHLDPRQASSRAVRYQLSDQKIGSVSLNPIHSNYLAVASNSRALRIWDNRNLRGAAEFLTDTDDQSNYPTDIIGSEAMGRFSETELGRSALRAEWIHGKSVSSAYWAPVSLLSKLGGAGNSPEQDGRNLVSTSYDDLLRLWDFRPDTLNSHGPFPTSRPLKSIKHNCQTGRWVSILRAQWSPNPEVFPYFTIANMKPHSLLMYSAKGDLLAKLEDKTRISAVQAITCSHPRIVERAATGCANGKVYLWGPADFW